MEKEIKLCINCENLKHYICRRRNKNTGIMMALDPEYQRSNSWFDKCGKNAKYFIPKEKELLK